MFLSFLECVVTYSVPIRSTAAEIWALEDCIVSNKHYYIFGNLCGVQELWGLDSCKNQDSWGLEHFFNCDAI